MRRSISMRSFSSTFISWMRSKSISQGSDSLLSSICSYQPTLIILSYKQQLESLSQQKSRNGLSFLSILTGFLYVIVHLSKIKGHQAIEVEGTISMLQANKKKQVKRLPYIVSCDREIIDLKHHCPDRLEQKSAKLQPYFFMCCQCFATARPISQIKQINRKGQYTGTRNIQNQVQIHAAVPIRSRLFQRLNQFIERRTGRSPSVLLRIDTLYSRNRVFYAQSSSGSGRPEGVKYCTIRQITYRPMMYISPKYSYLKILQSMQAQNNMRQPQRYRFQYTALQTMV